MLDHGQHMQQLQHAQTTKSGMNTVVSEIFNAVNVNLTPSDTLNKVTQVPTVNDQRIIKADNQCSAICALVYLP